MSVLWLLIIVLNLIFLCSLALQPFSDCIRHKSFKYSISIDLAMRFDRHIKQDDKACSSHSQSKGSGKGDQFRV